MRGGSTSAGGFASSPRAQQPSRGRTTAMKRGRLAPADARNEGASLARNLAARWSPLPATRSAVVFEKLRPVESTGARSEKEVANDVS